MYWSRGNGSQVASYLGRDGRNRDRPFLNRLRIGSMPKFREHIRDIADV